MLTSTQREGLAEGDMQKLLGSHRESNGYTLFDSDATYGGHPSMSAIDAWSVPPVILFNGEFQIIQVICPENDTLYGDFEDAAACRVFLEAMPCNSKLTGDALEFFERHAKATLVD